MCKIQKLITTVTFAFILISTTGCSDSTSSGYPERDIKIIIPYNAGGGFDSYIRALTPYIKKHLPNQVNVLPINTAGAGGRRGANDVYRATPDGYTLGVFNFPGILLMQLQDPGIDYDLSRITWLSTLSIDAYAYIVKGNSPIDSIDAVRQLGRPIVYGATGPSSTSYIATTIISDALEIPYQVITGYTGSSEYLVGVMRGDIDAAFVNLSTVRPYLESGDVKMLALFGIKSDNPAIADAFSLGIPELNNINVIRMMGAPPGLPDDIKTILETAMLAAMDDPEFKAWLQQTGNDVHPAGAEETTQAIGDMAAFYERFRSSID
jgi:tripartite-type tricarboxylate transporter receptor subunit TctC